MNLTLPTLADVDRDLVRRFGLREFVRLAWPRVEPMALRWGWHLDAVCEHLEALTRDELSDLVLNVPPGCSKSLVCSVLWPAWVWTQRPDWRWIAASYSPEVSLRDARKMRTLVESDWFRARWPEVRLPRDATASKAVGSFYTTAGGMRFSTTVRGSVTGQHGDAHVIDDPHDPAGVVSAAELEMTLAWWRETMPSRFRDPEHPRRVLVMQRLHERDLSAEMASEGATVLCLPMRFDAQHPQRWARDPRTRDGELLAPERYPERAVARLEARLGPTAAAAQLQQRPTPRGGAIFRTEWWRYWTELPAGGVWLLSLDCTFKGTDGTDFVSMGAWVQQGARVYLVDEVHDRMGFAQTCERLVAFCAQYPQATTKLVEDKANGPAVLDALGGRVPGLLPFSPNAFGSKEARAYACEPLFAAGNVLLPHPTDARYPDGRRGAPWVEAFRAELESFPRGAHDDRVDMTTQALLHLHRGGTAQFLEAMKRLGDDAAQSDFLRSMTGSR